MSCLKRSPSPTTKRSQARPRSAATAIGVSQVGPVIYVGPQQAAKYLRTLAELRKEDLRELPVAARGNLVRLRSWRWDDLATPRELFDQLTKETGVDIVGRQQVPHDLWAANDLPLMNFADRLTLLAVQFDLTFRFQGAGQQAVLEQIQPETLSIERSYPGGANPEAFAAQLQRALPEAAVRVAGGKVLVRGLMETHERIRDATVRGASSDTPSNVKTLFTFRVRNKSLSAVIEKIAADLKSSGVEVKVDRQAIAAAGIKLDQRVTFEVEKVDIDGLLTAILRGAGLTHRNLGKVIEILPAK